MKRNELLNSIAEFLNERQAVTAPGVDLLRFALAELQISGQAGAPVVKTVAAEIPAHLRTAETMAYDVLAELGIIPEEDDEPLPDLEAALAAEPELPQRALDLIGTGINGLKFADAVRRLLGAENVDNLNQLWGLLEAKGEYLTSLETELKNRDSLLADGDAAIVRLNAVREKLGIPKGVLGPVWQVENAAIDLLINQRQAAQARLLVGRDEAPAEDTLEAILEKIITITGLDWQDVETLPQHIQHIQQMHNDLMHNDLVDPDVRLVIAGWVNDCVDLAHAVRGDLSPENRVMAKAAQHIIDSAPRDIV